MQKLHLGDRLHLEYVERDHPAVGADPGHGDLAPATGAPKVDHQRAGFDQMKFIVDLRQLEGRARAETLPLRAGRTGQRAGVRARPAMRASAVLLSALPWRGFR